MNLYPYSYLTHNSNLLNNIFIGIGLLIGITILITGLKYLRDRTSLRYRNILITLFLFAVLIICIQIGRIQNQQSGKSQIGQTAQVMRNVSLDHHVPLKRIYTNSTSLNNGMILKVNRTFYTVHLNNDKSSYHLSKTHPINNQINYVRRNNISFNVNNGQYLNIAIKLLIGFIMLVIQINLAGKNNLAPSNAIDQLQNYVLGGIVGGIIYNQSITILQFIIVILIWSIIIFGSKILINQSDFFKNILNGSPQVIISHGRIDVNAALKSGLSASDIIFKLRSAGVNDFQSVKRVILEQNGQFSIDSYQDQTVNYPIITDGTVDDNVLKQMRQNRNWLTKVLKLKHHSIKDVYLGQIINGKLVLTLYPQHNITKFLPNKTINLKHYRDEFKRLMHEIRKYHQNHRHQQ